jgi:cell division protein FtsL
MHNKQKKTPQLINEMGHFVIQEWLLFVLLVGVIVSALQQIKMTHDIRNELTHLQNLNEKNVFLKSQWQQLNLEMNALSETNRLTQFAEEQLKMIKVNANNEIVIDL